MISGSSMKSTIQENGFQLTVVSWLMHCLLTGFDKINKGVY